MAKVFAWLRPNDLVWNYWVNNYLLGQNPPAFDILYWNNDTTRLPAGLHSDFLDLFLTNGLVEGTLDVLGTPVDLGKVSATPTSSPAPPTTSSRGTAPTGRRSCSAAPAEFVLSSSGHIQAIVNPPGNPKASYLTVRRARRRPRPSGSRARPQMHGIVVDALARLARRPLGRPRPRPSAAGQRQPPAASNAAPGRYVHL